MAVCDVSSQCANEEEKPPFYTMSSRTIHPTDPTTASSAATPTSSPTPPTHEKPYSKPNSNAPAPPRPHQPRPSDRQPTYLLQRLQRLPIPSTTTTLTTTAALATIITAIYAIRLQVLSWRLAAWTAVKDGKESCLADRQLGLDVSAFCAGFREGTAAPPVRRWVEDSWSNTWERNVLGYVPSGDVVRFCVGAVVSVAAGLVVWYMVRRGQEVHKPTVSLVRRVSQTQEKEQKVQGLGYEKRWEWMFTGNLPIKPWKNHYDESYENDSGLGDMEEEGEDDDASSSTESHIEAADPQPSIAASLFDSVPQVPQITFEGMSESDFETRFGIFDPDAFIWLPQAPPLAKDGFKSLADPFRILESGTFWDGHNRPTDYINTVFAKVTTEYGSVYRNAFRINLSKHLPDLRARQDRIENLIGLSVREDLRFVFHWNGAAAVLVHGVLGAESQIVYDAVARTILEDYARWQLGLDKLARALDDYGKKSFSMSLSSVEDKLELSTDHRLDPRSDARGRLRDMKLEDDTD